MRHRNAKATLNRPADQRRAMVRNLLTSLFAEGKIKTTDARAKAVSSEAEKLITKIQGKDTHNAIRELKKILFTDVSSKAALQYAQEKKNRTGGYTRLTRIGQRAGDNATLVQVELISNN